MYVSDIDTSDLRSVSVEPEQVIAVGLAAGEKIWCQGKPHSWDKRVVLMVDRLGGYTERPTCTMIRQVLVCPLDQWGQDYAKPCAVSRRLAREGGYPVVTVPGGIPPLTLEGQIAIPDFAMSGTRWYIVPEWHRAAVEADEIVYLT